ncbi:MFS transporter [Allosaccharopolyspora coralli]|uniref:MFS transporter n=1 Tax=Allosaccharopolyspora coralli TaxID=2665642 RepID=A0A5Q3Q7Y5_9PSEU|nr:MFS transporter [Allosaccharopolyspora coralli]QGK69930.1 MFS transporter [Allosaccharopolyspora coralli]
MTVPTERPRLERGVLLLLAVASGVAVGNVYFPQAISPLISSGLGVPPASAALVVTSVQLGYGAGIFLLVPLGDRVPNRNLIVTLLMLTAGGLVAAGMAPGLSTLFGAGVLVGVTTVVAPLIAAMTVGLVADDRRGEVTGILLSGSTGGMLLSRAFGGTVGEWLGWRAPYIVAAAAVVLVAVALMVTVPRTRPTSTQRYPALLVGVLRVLREEPELRRSCFYQASVFGGFSAVWTGIALVVTGPIYGLDARVVGLLALVGAATMVAAPVAGRMVDRRGPDRVTFVCVLGVLGSAAILAVGAVGGAPGLVALLVGTLLLDVTMQSGMVANVARIFAVRPESRSRMNTAYMTCAYLGGALGSWAGARCYAHLGWLGVCGLLAVLSGLALLRHVAHRVSSRVIADEAAHSVSR